MATEINSLTDDAFEKLKRDHESLKLMVKNLKLRMEGVRQGTVPATGLIGYADEEIPGVTGATPGSATVTIYKIDDAGELAVTFNSQLVFNVSDKPIAAESYFPVTREWPSARYVCYGKDEASGSGSGSGGDGGNCSEVSYIVKTGSVIEDSELVESRIRVTHLSNGCTEVESLDPLCTDICDPCTGGSGSGSGSGYGSGSGSGGEDGGDCSAVICNDIALPASTSCEYCDTGTAPTFVYVGIAGIVDAEGCTNCDGYNGVYKLAYDETSCQYESCALTDPCDPTKEYAIHCTLGDRTIYVSIIYDLGGMSELWTTWQRFPEFDIDCDGGVYSDNWVWEQTSIDCDVDNPSIFVSFDPAVCSSPASIETTCCSELFPDTITATFSLVTVDAGGCDGLDGQTIDLSYDLDDSKWKGTETIDGVEITIHFYCNGSSDWVWDQWCGGISTVTNDFSSESCDPIEFVTNAHGHNYCCSVSDLAEWKITFTG